MLATGRTALSPGAECVFHRSLPRMDAIVPHSPEPVCDVQVREARRKRGLWVPSICLSALFYRWSNTSSSFTAIFSPHLEEALTPLIAPLNGRHFGRHERNLRHSGFRADPGPLLSLPVPSLLDQRSIFTGSWIASLSGLTSRCWPVEPDSGLWFRSPLSQPR